MAFPFFKPITLSLIIFSLFYAPMAMAQDKYSAVGKFVGGQSLSQLWELSEEHEQGTFVVTPYRPIYFMMAKYSNDMNENPKSVSLSNSLEQPIGYDNIEAAFQISLKTKVFHNILWNKADLWLAYTQSAFHQIYNKPISRPMRELNYEPELILNVPMRFRVLGFTGRMAGVSLNHVSNGRDLPLSRSWNRIIFHVALEHKNWQVYLRSWVRLQSMEDNNPKINDYLGRGDIRILKDIGNHRLTFIGQHSLNFAGNRGSARLDWTFPIRKNLNGYLRAFHGYGESLIDYNHTQTTVGFGISLID